MKSNAGTVGPAPEVGVDGAWHLEQFWKLHTERRFEGGPIPRSAVDAVAAAAELGEVGARVLARAIAALDSEWLKDRDAQIAQERAKLQKGGGAGDGPPVGPRPPTRAGGRMRRG